MLGEKIFRIEKLIFLPKKRHLLYFISQWTPCIYYIVYTYSNLIHIWVISLNTKNNFTWRNNRLENKMRLNMEYSKLISFHTNIIILYYKSISDWNWRENDYNWACFIQIWPIIIFFFYVIIAIWEWIVKYFSSYLHDKHCIFASILLINYKILLYVNKLTWKDNVFMSMTWKVIFINFLKDVWHA